jgi:uncharacterized protein (UPF0332 family)
MDSKVKIYLERAENELRLSRAIFNLSGNEGIKVELQANPDDSFYSSVIGHAYYSIFYCAKAYLIFKRIELPEQGQHQAVYYKFKKLVIEGVVDKELIEIYENAIVKADELLGLFEYEKKKRSDFVYQTIPQANIEPAKESIENTVKFLSNIKLIFTGKEVKDD